MFGVLSLGSATLDWLRSALYQRELREMLARGIASMDGAKFGAGTSPGRLDLVGQLTIPRLELSAMIAEGDDDTVLSAAIGHLPETPFPWQSGNSALAAHRDGFFRPLKDVRLGDDLIVTSPIGRLEYRVRETLIVEPDEVWILAPTDRPTITLITCYPFSYVGHAPQRFIVRAEREAEPRRVAVTRTRGALTRISRGGAL